MSDKPLRVLVLTSSTGGGHDSRARALRAWSVRDTTNPTLEVELHQALEEAHVIYRFGVGIYNTIQRFWPRLHHIYYNVLEVGSFASGSGEGSVMGRASFQAVVRKIHPDLVVSTHDHLNHGFFAACREALPDAPPKCATYSTELFGGYGFSKHWVNPKADLFIGAVPEVCEEAHRLGMARERIFLGGFLLHPAFWTPHDQADNEKFQREELNLEPGRFTILLSTGANSAQNHIALLNALIADGPLPAPAQVVALCGHDDRALAELHVWAQRHPELLVRPVPRLMHLAQVMRVTSVVVARPGTGTTTEAILSGTPILFNTLGGIMPQEIITVKFCQKHRFGKVIKHPREFAAQIRAWLADPATHAAEQARVRASNPDCIPTGILNRLRELVANRR
jgi:processive 1,2-diacylglycerol beta-glucosyltransferase